MRVAWSSAAGTPAARNTRSVAAVIPFARRSARFSRRSVSSVRGVRSLWARRRCGSALTCALRTGMEVWLAGWSVIVVFVPGHPLVGRARSRPVPKAGERSILPALNVGRIAAVSTDVTGALFSSSSVYIASPQRPIAIGGWPPAHITAEVPRQRWTPSGFVRTKSGILGNNGGGTNR